MVKTAQEHKVPAEMLIELKGTESAPALDALVQRYFTMVYSTCLRITRDRHDAEDASQATFLCLARQLHERKDIRAMGPWLYQVACNASVDICRKRKRRATHEPLGARPEAVGMADDPACKADLAEIRPAVLEQLNKLPTRYRLPLILHYFGGLPSEQLAEELSCTRATLRVRLCRGHKMLRKALEKRGICLAGGLLGAILAEAIRSQVSEGLVGSTIALGRQVSHYGLQACSASPSILAASQAAAAGGRARFWIVISLAAASLLTISAPLLAKLKDLPNWPTPLDIAPFKLPELTAPLPKLSDAAPSPAQPKATPSAKARPAALAQQQPQTPTLHATPLPRSTVAAAHQPLSIGSTDLSSPAPTHSPTLPRTAPPTYAVHPANAAFTLQPNPPSPARPDHPAEHLALRQSPKATVSVAPRTYHLTWTAEPPTVIAATFQPATSSPWHDPVATNTNANLQIDFATAGGSTGTVLYSYLPDGQRVVLTTNTNGLERELTSADSVSGALDRAMFFTYAVAGASSANTLHPLQILRNNGQVIADGRQESYQWCDRVQNDIDNPRGGFNGWFAMNGGRLALPSIAIQKGTHSYNWGEDASDTTPDLINSVRLTATASADSTLDIALLATDASGLPQFPAGHHFISAYELSGGQTITGSIATLIRYDDARLTYLGLDESQVKLWYYTDPATGWQRAYGNFGRDLTNDWVYADVPAGAQYIAVSTPEPTSLALLATGALLLLRRKRA